MFVFYVMFEFLIFSLFIVLLWLLHLYLYYCDTVRGVIFKGRIEMQNIFVTVVAVCLYIVDRI